MESISVFGKPVDVKFVLGTVLASHKTAQTHVHGGGGGVTGQVNAGYGQFSSGPVQIGSTTTMRHQLWIRTDDGSEVCFQLPDDDTPVREGQRVAAITVDGRLVRLVNLTAQTMHHLVSVKQLASDLQINSGYYVINPFQMWALVILVSMFGFGWWAPAVTLILMIAGTWFVLWCVLRKHRARRPLEKALEACEQNLRATLNQ